MDKRWDKLLELLVSIISQASIYGADSARLLGELKDAVDKESLTTESPSPQPARVSVAMVRSLLMTADELYLENDSWDEPTVFFTAWLRAHGVEVVDAKA